MIALTALVCAALFTGAAFYVSFAEHPARLKLHDAPALAQWKPAYARGTMMQAALAGIGGVLGIVAWSRWHSNWFWLAGGVLLLVNILYTLLVIWPTNGALKAAPVDQAGPRTRELLVRWGQLHLVRTLLGVLATAAIWYGLKPN